MLIEIQVMFVWTVLITVLHVLELTNALPAQQGIPGIILIKLA